MSEPFLGEIRIFAGSYAPVHWAFCDGQLIPISQNDALFSLLGTIYGGDGRTTFALPDMRGRIPVHQGTGPGLTSRRIGDSLGMEQVALQQSQLPQHSHQLFCSSGNGTSTSPTNHLYASVTDEDFGFYGTPGGTTVQMADGAVQSAGGNQGHTNMMPYQCLSFIICTNGIFPSRN